MKRTVSHGNGNGAGTSVRFTSETIEGNPYLQRPQPDESNEEVLRDEDGSGQLIDDEDGAPIDPEDAGLRAKQRRRRLTLMAFTILFLAALFAALLLYYRSATRVEYGRTTKPREALPPPPNVNPSTGRDSRTEHAIEEAQRLTTDKQRSVGNAYETVLESADGTASPKTNIDVPFKAPPGFSDPINIEDAKATQADTQRTLGFERRSEAITSNGTSPSEEKGTPSQRSSETSLYMNEPTAARVNSSQGNVSKKQVIAEARPRTVTLPPFASVLPVRTVGALFTLRTGALVRLELTRDASGDGWSMKRRTLLVGTTKGSDFDRAYVNVLGFIDPSSGRFVKLGGEVRGGDGGEGLKGKRRQLDGGWARAFARVTDAALGLTGAFLSGRGGGTVIVSDGFRTRAINPITEEVSGVLGGELNRKQRQGFVEVLAGTPGYVMVTDLPAMLRGTEANPELDEKSLALLTDVDAARPATGLSERELAELLASGSPEEIRAAMPRMTSDMRKIAAALLPP